MDVPKNTLLEINDLKTHFFFDEGVVKAVDGVSYSIEKGKTLGVVGESGVLPRLLGAAEIRRPQTTQLSTS